MPRQTSYLPHDTKRVAIFSARSAACTAMAERGGGQLYLEDRARASMAFARSIRARHPHVTIDEINAAGRECGLIGSMASARGALGIAG